jgi:hypothetical protein
VVLNGFIPDWLDFAQPSPVGSLAAAWMRNSAHRVFGIWAISHRGTNSSSGYSRRRKYQRRQAVTKEFKKGEAVSWNTSQGKTEGKVVRKQTSPTKIKSHEVEASKDDPQYIVQSTKSGNKAAHHPEQLHQEKRSASDK